MLTMANLLKTRARNAMKISHVDNRKQSLEPSPLPHRTCISRELESGAGGMNSTQTI